MQDSVTVRGANAATGLVLSVLLVCGVIVVSDTGTYALPTGEWQAPLMPDARSDVSGGAAPADATRQSITVPFTVREQRAPARNGGGPSARRMPVAVRPASVEPLPERVPDRRDDIRPGRATSTKGASERRPERGDRRGRSASSQHDAAPAARGKPRGVRTFRSAVGSAPFGRGF
ncbi:MAG: hypothetical protein GEU97_08070 [Actinophytocola sp.]|nr:hypothetical protein [Actinophytocola sp.]